MTRKNIRIPVFGLSVMIVLLSACSIGKNYKRPELNVPNAYRNANSTDSSSVADLPWKEFFADPTLQHLVENALAKNFDMRIALQNIESAKQTVKQSKAAFAPDVNFTVDASINRPSGTSLNGVSLKQFLGRSYLEDYSARFSIAWEIDIWGKMRRGKEAAQAQYLQSGEAVRAIQTKLIADVSGGYYNLLMLDAQLVTARKNLGLNDSILQITRLRQQVGEVTSLAVQLVEAQQQTAAILVPQLEEQIAVQENALHLLAGEWPDRIERSTKLNEVVLTDNLSAGFPVSILARRPDVKASELSLKAANAKVGIAQASMYPSLTINASAGLNSFTAGNWFNIPGALFGTFLGGLTQPLFNRRQLKTQFELAKVEREKAIVEFQRTVTTGVGEVANALVRVEKLKSQQEVANARVKTLQSALSDARLLYQTGSADYLEVITAQSNLLQGELQAAAITCNLYLAKVELYRALGGGWK